MRRVASALSALMLFASLPPSVASAVSPLTGAVRASPLAVEFTVEEGLINVGTTTVAAAAVANMGQSAVRLVELHLRVDASVQVLPSSIRTFRVLPGGRQLSASWRICPTRPGNYLVLVEASGQGQDGVTYRTETAARMLEVADSAITACRGGNPRRP